MEKKLELYKAIANVMKDVKGIDKSMTVGEGKNSYSAVSDKDVKMVIGGAMQEHGLICVPKSYEPKMNIERWEEVDPWSKSTPKDKKIKQSVFVEMQAVYELIHVESGQSIEIPAYGHGIDPQDKSAGKATTYALKNALLYTFLVPTGAIDDTDKEHSDNKSVPQQPKQTQQPKPAPQKQPLNGQRFADALKAIKDGKTTADKVRAYALTDEQEKQLKEFETINKNK